MNIINKEEFIAANPFLVGASVIVGTSGGRDSMALLHLLHSVGVEVVAAHCNFQLRGAESDSEEAFVEAFAKEQNIPFEAIRFSTKAYAAKRKLNTQLAARELRYEWFEKLRKAYSVNYVAVAHHADDNLETFFINLFRGTGLLGLKGIPSHNGQIIRPLLPYTRASIMEYILKEKIPFCDDSSNASDNYLRNRIRHHLTPVLQSLQPQIYQVLALTQANLKTVQSFISTEINRLRKEIFSYEENYIYCNINQIKHHPERNFIALELFKPYGFTAINELEKLFNAQVGKLLQNEKYTLRVEQQGWLLVPLLETQEKTVYVIENEVNVNNLPLRFSFEYGSVLENTSPNEVLLNAQKINFPLYLKKPEQGMYFYPKGMKMKKKSLAKFFRDEKYSSINREKQWLLTTTAGEIIWVVGKRADERFVAGKETGNILKIKLL